MSLTATKSTPPAPLPFQITDTTQLEDWKKWQRSFRYYANSINLEQKSHDVQLSTFKSLVGPDALEIYNTFSILDITDVESVIRKFDEHFKPKVNVTLERFKLYKMHQKSGQNFEDFLSDLTNQVDKCEFRTMRDEIVLYKIVGGIDSDEVRNALLAGADLKYDEAVQICRASSAIHFSPGKENFCQSSVTKKMGGNTRTPKGSRKDMRKSVRRSIKISQKVESNLKQVTDLRKPNVSKCGDVGRTTESFVECVLIKEEDNFKLSLEYSDLDENRAELENEDVGTDGDSDWRADDVNCDEDDGVEISVDGEKKRRLRKRKLKRNCDPSVSSEKPGSFPCEICGRAVGTKRDLIRHVMTHVQKDKVTCHHCGGRYKQKRYLVRHIVRSHPGVMQSKGAPKIYVCEVCGYKTNQGANLRRHKYQHTEERPFSCELCEYKCIVPRLMKAHMAKHTGEKPLVCSVCPKGFVESNALKKHMLTHMTPEEREKHLSEERTPTAATCETCGKVFSSRGALKTHSVVHTGERPFACSVCDYRAGQKAALNAHMAKHSEEKPFVCTVCGYSCKLKRVLQVHMNIHTGDRPYACTVCDSKFKQIAHLQVHMRTHTGEKPYVCDICGHRWAKQSNLTQHMKVHQNQAGDPLQYTPPRKRQKKRKSDVPPTEPAPVPANAIPQWSEQVSTINPMECFLNLEIPPPFQPSYPTPQANPRPPDCRYFQQRQLQNQNHDAETWRSSNQRPSI